MTKMKSFNLTIICALLAAVPLVHGQGAPVPSSAARRAVLVVDTDDACRLTIDDEDEGLLAVTAAKKINIAFGQHIVKCVIESTPDLMWRKIIDVKNFDTIALIVSLKALHIQYEEASSQLQNRHESSLGGTNTGSATGGKIGTINIKQALFATNEGAQALAAFKQKSTHLAQGDAQAQMTAIAQPILTKMAPMIVKYAQSNGFTVVMDTSTVWPEGPILWYDKSSDLTKPLVDIYNAQSGPPPKTKP